jgi:outer membrane lipoprotein-sorting protein
MSYLRRISTRSLILVLVGVCLVAVGGTALAIAAGGGGSTPPAEPLDQAIQRALDGNNAPAGVTARVQFTNNLFPSGALLGQAASALISGASGRLWLTGDGQGRIELQSDAGDVQIVWDSSTISAYDASSNTVYRADLPSSAQSTSGSSTDTPPTLADIDSFLTNIGVDWALSDAQPTDIAGQPAYSASVSPKHDGGLLGSLELAWDASNGTPLQAAIYAQGNSTPVLQLTVTDISYGPVAASDVNVAPPAGATVVDLSSVASGQTGSSTPAVTGLAAVQAAAPFTVVAPDTLVGLPLQDVRLVGGDTVLVSYGQGLGGIALVERKADSSNSDGGVLSNLPTVSLDGLTAHELATQLGTVLEWQSGGTSYVLAGSLPAAAAEAAARAVK